MSEVKVNKISPSSGTAFTLGDSGDTFTVPSGATIVNSGTATGFGGGKIGQIVQTVNTGTETLSSTTPTTISDFTVAITPTATSSKILVFVNAQFGAVTTYTFGVQLFRDTTQIFLGDAASSRARSTWSSKIQDARQMFMMAQLYLDSPSTTSEVDYSCKWFSESSQAIYMSRTHSDNDNAEYDQRTASSITAMEVLA